jgi:hypothetical protein
MLSISVKIAKGVFKPLYKPYNQKLNVTIKQRKTKAKCLFESIACSKNDEDFFQLYLPYFNILARNKNQFNRLKGCPFTNEQKTFLQSQFTLGPKTKQHQQRLDENSMEITTEANDKDEADCCKLDFASDNHATLVKNRSYDYQINCYIAEVQL